MAASLASGALFAWREPSKVANLPVDRGPPTETPAPAWSSSTEQTPALPRIDANVPFEPTGPGAHEDSKSVHVLAEHCAPSAPSATLISIVRVESDFAPWTIRVNGPAPAILRPASRDHAVRIAKALVSGGRNIDLGLAQINSRNLPRLGLSVRDALDPCRNLAAAAVILNRGYERALVRAGPDRSLLQTAYSLYNTGDTERGLNNGYAAKVEAAARMAGQ